MKEYLFHIGSVKIENNQEEFFTDQGTARAVAKFNELRTVL